MRRLQNLIHIDTNDQFESFQRTRSVNSLFDFNLFNANQKSIIFFFLFLASIIILTGCATQRKPLEPFRYEDSKRDYYQLQEHLREPTVRLSEYKDAQSRPGQDPNLALAVSISGGGFRAANFALGVLQALEEEGRLQEIDYFSTVSGGGFAAAGYLSSLKDSIDSGGRKEVN